MPHQLAGAVRRLQRLLGLGAHVRAFGQLGEELARLVGHPVDDAVEIVGHRRGELAEALARTPAAALAPWPRLARPRPGTRALPRSACAAAPCASWCSRSALGRALAGLGALALEHLLQIGGLLAARLELAPQRLELAAGARGRAPRPRRAPGAAPRSRSAALATAAFTSSTSWACASRAPRVARARRVDPIELAAQLLRLAATWSSSAWRCSSSAPRCSPLGAALIELAAQLVAARRACRRPAPSCCRARPGPPAARACTRSSSSCSCWMRPSRSALTRAASDAFRLASSSAARCDSWTRPSSDFRPSRSLAARAASSRAALSCCSSSASCLVAAASAA